LLPGGGKQALSQQVGFVGIRKESENRIRKARAYKNAQGKGSKTKGKKINPLASFKGKRK
jgi:ATP-dependent RNA helicase DDX56/DBP9